MKAILDCVAWPGVCGWWSPRWCLRRCRRRCLGLLFLLSPHLAKPGPRVPGLDVTVQIGCWPSFKRDFVLANIASSSRESPRTLVSSSVHHVDQQRNSPPRRWGCLAIALATRDSVHVKWTERSLVITIKPNILHIHRANIMKVKCTFLAKNVSINAFNGVTMLLFPPRIKKHVAAVAALESEVGNPNAAVCGCMIEFRSG